MDAKRSIEGFPQIVVVSRRYYLELDGLAWMQRGL